ncbi:MAG: hypothetical protein R3B13_00790 [Polyangiaceae bacterium]
MNYRAYALPCLACCLASALAACAKNDPSVTREGPAASASVKEYDESPRPATGATETQVSGKIVEVLAHPSYSYLLLDTGSEKVWTAVPRAEVKVGDQVTVERAILMQGYRSASLKRDFEKVYFGTLKGHKGISNALTGGHAASPHGSGAPMPSGSVPTPSLDVKDVKVAKVAGANGYTVSEVITGVDKLTTKPASVRGIVVKFNPGIMGKNWLHLQDGSGSAADKSNDLAVTLPADQRAARGDTVVVHGKVLKDQDVGGGYRFSVLLEGERVEVEKTKAAK